jgi:phospholipase/carboxylesterase
MISVEAARASRDALTKLGVPVSYREYEMAHEINHEAQRQLLSWLDEKVINPILLA